ALRHARSGDRHRQPRRQRDRRHAEHDAGRTRDPSTGEGVPARLFFWHSTSPTSRERRVVQRSKLPRAKVTSADVSYLGSIAIDRDLIERSGLWIGEKCSWSATRAALVSRPT